MRRSATTLKTLSASAALVLALAASGCLAEVDAGEPASGKPANATGSFGVAAAIIAGVEVEEVTYVVSGNGIDPLTGSIPLTDPGATISTQIGGLPAGTGYTVTLNATSVSGNIACTGSATFDVLLGQTTPVDLVMTCSSANDGSTILVGLDSSVSQCPNLNAGQSAPFELLVGERMLVDSGVRRQRRGPERAVRGRQRRERRRLLGDLHARIRPLTETAPPIAD